MRKCYIINYDLRKQKDYEPLYEAIRSYGTYAHILESCWAVVTTKSASEVFDHLRREIDEDDGLFAVKSGREAKWVNIIYKDQWLKDNL